MKVTLVKLGGSVITDKLTDSTPRLDVIKHLSQEIKQAQDQNPDLHLVVGHGGGSYGHFAAKKYQTQKGMISDDSLKGIAVVQDAMQRLNRIVVKEMLQVGVDAVSLQSSAMMTAGGGVIDSVWFVALEKFIKLGLVVVPYGDVVCDSTQGVSIVSTEKILHKIVETWQASDHYQVDRIIMVGNTDGVYKNYEPGQSEIYNEINQQNFETIKRFLQTPGGADVTGGMLHKLKVCLRLADKGVQTLIINGSVPGRLKSALLGEEVKGTVVRS